MDQDFIKRAEKPSTFNIPTTFFQTTEKKKEIQYLFKKHFFSMSDSESISTTIVNQENLNNVITNLKTKDIVSFKQMHNYKLTGIGPGEISLYVMVDTAKLGGPSSNGMDLEDDCGSYEIKSSCITKDGDYAYNFELGRGVYLNDISVELLEYKNHLGLQDGKDDVNVAQLNVIRELLPKEYQKVENLYRERAYVYFKDHKTIFINNSIYSPCGRIEAIKHVNFDDISIERLTRGTIKPKIKL